MAWSRGSSARPSRAGATALAPQTVGLPAGGRRRAAGLRREELALLAGISVDYLTRLEQGRATIPSAQVVEALARALRLSDAERELLFRLAGPGRARARCRPDPHHAERAAAARPARGHPGRRLRRGVEPARGQPALRGADGRPVVARDRTQRRVAQPRRPRHPRRPHPGGAGAAFESLLVADLRMTAARYPADRELGG